MNSLQKTLEDGLYPLVARLRQSHFDVPTVDAGLTLDRANTFVVVEAPWSRSLRQRCRDAQVRGKDRLPALMRNRKIKKHLPRLVADEFVSKHRWLPP